MSGATPSDSGFVNTSVQVGGAIGLAVLATLATGRSKHLLAHGATNASALNSGYHLAYVIGAGLVLAALAVVGLVLRTTPATAHAHEVGAPAAEPLYSEAV